jgi:hypothetical protein
MKLIRCDYCTKEVLNYQPYYTVEYPIHTIGGWSGDKHFCSPYCVSEYFYALDEKAKEKNNLQKGGEK